MTVWHSSTDKQVKLAQPQQFMAEEHEAVEMPIRAISSACSIPAFFRLGDTLCTGAPVRYSGIPCLRPSTSPRAAPRIA